MRPFASYPPENSESIADGDRGDDILRSDRQRRSKNRESRVNCTRNSIYFIEHQPLLDESLTRVISSQYIPRYELEMGKGENNFICIPS